MKNQIIHITSLEKGAQVSIRNGLKKLKTRRFTTIAEAKEFVLPQGNHQTELYLNGFKCVLNGWV